MAPRSKINSSLGKAIIRKRFEGKRRPTENDTELHTTVLDDGPSWTKLQSITQQGDLEEFLHTAELAGTEFTAERMNVKIIAANHTANPYLLSADEEAQTLQKHRENSDRLKVPRRPAWDSTTTANQLHRDERESFMNWRRQLAMLQDEQGLLLTPFERNLEVWRQLWRVLERSHLVVQIVDARNPMLFHSRDLGDYVKEIDPRKRSLLLINKADMLSEAQREAWAAHFVAEGIPYLFFSAKESNEKLEAEREREEAEKLAHEMALNTVTEDQFDEMSAIKDALAEVQRKAAEEVEKIDPEDAFEASVRAVNLSDEELRTRVLAPAELVSILMRECPKIANEHSHNKLVIGLVGYPNVGKSSTINALVGSKKVNVGAMPGKTKHFQTIHLTSDVLLCDCPGLVFPTFATTQADMVCNGVLPIDQLREFTGPSGLIAKRLPKWALEAIYGIEIRTRPIEEGGSGIPTAEELLTAYAAARGMFKGGEGNPDEARAARVLLKDYVGGKLVYCHSPPGWSKEDDFNIDHYNPQAIAKRTRHLIEEGSEFSVKHAASDRNTVKDVVATSGSVRIDALDSRFFSTGAALLNAQRRAGTHEVKQGKGFAQMQIAVAARSNTNNRGEIEAISGTEAARLAALEHAGKDGKKSHKKRRAGKQRSGKGVYEEL
ncbi:hypothetical protein BX661DRAFT_175851 [Kickxella alabastrina]|uniref:uncharacterized protein n=1 Tax=Kickxella alabastrina TaxID=61397 RepID=UPI002220D12D|nr:uncharacterized protein BX661DRAFT_175851 [Kickxella alabastrina]KAI7834963.1 hypothetical protein BX661DRAFT_175851 [Kickxella alabastrina]KAJ1947874.1 hypothetical protein GGF37_000021 [Kickxella alabastrina]